MHGIQPSALSDAEFERLVFLSLNKAGDLPPEVARELAARAIERKDIQTLRNATNPKQIPLPL